MENYKIVAVGDGATGKTSLLQTFALNKFPELYEPTIFDNYSATIMYNENIITLNLWDCAGQEDYKDMRKLSYPYTNAFVLCYSCISPASYKNLERWINELKEYEQHAKIVIVCTKIDCMKDADILNVLLEKGITPLTTADMLSLNKKWPDIPTIECSSKKGWNIQQVFYTAVDLIKRKESSQKGCCVIN